MIPIAAGISQGLAPTGCSAEVADRPGPACDIGFVDDQAHAIDQVGNLA